MHGRKIDLRSVQFEIGLRDHTTVETNNEDCSVKDTESSSQPGPPEVVRTPGKSLLWSVVAIVSEWELYCQWEWT